MRNGRAESTVGIPPEQDPNTHCEWDEDEFVAEFLAEDSIDSLPSPSGRKSRSLSRRNYA